MVTDPKDDKKESIEEEYDENEEYFSDDPNDSRFGISEVVKKIVSAGIGAAFMTEENIRSYLGNIKLPKDVMHVLLQNANKSKQELLDRVTNEVVKIVKKIDFVEEASRFVEEHKFKVSAEIEVIRKEN